MYKDNNDRDILFSGLLLASSFLAMANANAGVYFSEYVEGSSLNKALEIYNGDTGNTVDLAGYRIEIFFNGNTAANTTVNLTGSIVPGDVYVVTDDGADAAILAQTDLTTTSSLFNGNDAIVLYNHDMVVDSIGQIGFNPGTEWGTGLTGTADNTLRRLSGVVAGDTDPFDVFDPALEWEGFANNTFDGLGGHNGSLPPPPPPAEACGDTATLISAVQGDGANSPLTGDTVSVEAVVVGDFQGSGLLRGFYIQEEAVDQDGDNNTSEGLFVFDGGNGVDVNSGDRVRVRGEVKEFNGLTELSNVTLTLVCAGEQTLPPATAVYLPVDAPDAYENVENMLVTLPQTLTVSENFDLGRFGQVLLSNGRLYNPTNIVAPGTAALAQQAANDLNRLLLDDGSNAQNPDPVVFPAPELSPLNTLRSGDNVSNVMGILDYAFGAYRVLPTVTPVFNASNARTDAPELDAGGSLKVAGFNVLNYFNGDGLVGGFPTSRGADNAFEFNRQRDKIISAIVAMDADIVGLIEIENDGYGPNSAIADLVNGINAQVSPGNEYRFIDPGVPQIGSDEIAVGFIYRNAAVTPRGNAAILSSANSIEDPKNPGQPLFLDEKNRPALAQTFKQLSNDQVFTVVVNHFKSKGSDCNDVGDPDRGDGQGNCSQTRNKAARALAAWLETDPTNSDDDDTLIIGDLNSYAKEDSIGTLTAAGYTDLLNAYAGNEAYSYVFFGQAGYLDHALASPGLRSQVADATVWHINADEPRVLDYNEEFKSPAQVSELYSADPYRSSDHDPVIVSLNLVPPNQAPTADFVSFVLFKWAILASTGRDADGHITSYRWAFGDDQTAGGRLTLHRYSKSGNYTVTHKVIDNEGGSAVISRSVNIR